MHHLIEAATAWILGVISHLGYTGLFTGMMAQAVGIPLPSELMLSFAGYLASTHVFSLPLVIAVGAAGDIAGAVIAYLIGYHGGRPFLVKFGRFLFVRAREIDRADRWFARYGPRAVIICKLLPGVRALGSFPAGVTHMAFAPFFIYSVLGSVIWAVIFSEIGFVLGKNWETLANYVRPFSLILIGLLVVAAAFWIWSHFRGERAAPAAADEQGLP
ncbi:MAG: alkaline phosphatase [Candidatus Eremiobacter antarcticus]|nr:DedA family protein [Candidatus Eremiobacteraeota bacterium]MBC5808605.1 DedA family protein [Candidatus Eremiobacteraeota bacterium]PZR61130.1 MAG: alkaline phosphatase [Candidatus Eremiobacter sp. RRmetagenome_bin22]